jgi:hypothetical protein
MYMDPSAPMAMVYRNFSNPTVTRLNRSGSASVSVSVLVATRVLPTSSRMRYITLTSCSLRSDRIGPSALLLQMAFPTTWPGTASKSISVRVGAMPDPDDGDDDDDDDDDGAVGLAVSISNDVKK